MIPARPTAWADRIFHPYLMWLFRRHFHAARILGKRPETDPELPILLLPNHSTWWDGFFVYLLNKKLFARRPYLMMLEEQLARYSFFARLGAFSINPQSPASVRKSLEHAAAILRQPSTSRSLLCIFPQGELLPWGRRPLEYKRGLEVMLKVYGDKVNLLPLAIKTEFLNERLPEALFLFGENQIADSDNFPGMKFLQDAQEHLLDDLAARILRGEKGITLLDT